MNNNKLLAFISIFTMVISFSFTTQSFAITLLEKPYTFTSGEPAYASQVNLNFDKLYKQINEWKTQITIRNSQISLIDSNVFIGQSAGSKNTTGNNISIRNAFF